MQRLALALAVTAITLCWGSVTRAQVATAFYPVGGRRFASRFPAGIRAVGN